MKNTPPMNTPAKKRLRSRFVDATGDEPQPTACHSEKPAAKRTNNKRQAKRKGAAQSKPESVPLHKTTPATSSHAGGDGSESNPGPAVVPSTPAVKKKKAPLAPRQGTRASARLRAQNPTATQEPMPAGPQKEQTKRKRESDEENPVELTDEGAKGTDDHTDTPVQADTTTPSDSPPADLISNENVTKQPADVAAEENAPADFSEDESPRPRFYLREMRDNFAIIALGFP